jgi:hypothetical protein
MGSTGPAGATVAPMEIDRDEDITDESEMAGKIELDMASKYADLRCPVHNVPPQFELAEDGSVIERLCCEALAQIFHELQATEAEDEVTEELQRPES